MGEAQIMRVAISGSTGLIGTALVRSLRADGHDVVRLVRGAAPFPGSEVTVVWDPAGGSIDAAGLEGVDAVVNLSGRSIGAKRWNEGEKQLLVSSRTESTGLLARTLASLERPPAVFLSASAIGVYGDRGDEALTEASPAGAGFLADLCRRWEAATEPAEASGVRVCHLRTGLVLSGEGGFLRRPALLTRLFLGGPLGSGRQWWSWIDIDDEVGAIRFLLDHPTVAGPVNLTAPQPERNRDFTRVMGRVLGRPTVLPAPAFAIRLALGRELADEVILAGQKVLPATLEGAGYRFAHTDAEASLRHALGRPA